MTVSRRARWGVAAMFAAGIRLLPEAGAVPGPPSRSLEFDSIAVDPARISPNGDRRADSVLVTYKLDDTTVVDVHVTPAGQPDTVAVLVPNRQQGPARVTVTWRGRDRSGQIVPDGTYTLRFAGRTVSEGRILQNDRPVVVDTRSPVPQILAIQPPVFTPGVSGASTKVRFRIGVTGAELGDTLRVALRVPRSLSLRPVDPFVGDGEYVVACDSCATDKVGDGAHTLEVTGADAAGNRTRVTGTFDKDVLGPRIRLRHPGVADTEGALLAVQRADSLAGVAFDRHGTAQIALRAVIGTDTIPVAIPGSTAGPDTLRWSVQIAALLANEGTYPLLLTAADPYGVTDTLGVELRVDRTAPPSPVFDPVPGPVSKSQEIRVVLEVDPAQTKEVVRTGGASPPETRLVTGSRIGFDVRLRPGGNALAFTARDLAGNASAPATTIVDWQTGAGLAFPERFRPGNVIQVNAGEAPAQRAEVRIFATDGTLVRRFESDSSQLVYEFPWDLSTAAGSDVRNGAYVVHARVVHEGGREDTYRGLLAVLQ